MEKYTRYQLSLFENNGNSTSNNIYPPFWYEPIKGPIRVIGSSDSDGNVTYSRENSVATLVVDGKKISFNEKLWFKVVETMLSLNLEIINSNNK